MRLLPERADYEGRRLAVEETEPHRWRYRRCHERQHLPLWDLSQDSPRHSSSGRNGQRGDKMSARALMNRREFVRTGAAAGGGLLVALCVPLPLRARNAQAGGRKDIAVNAFVRIGTDETVTVISAHSEMGQGIYTSLPMLLNEELAADWSKVRVEAAPVDAVYNNPIFGMQMTGGSTTSLAEWERYRKMGAI